MPTVLGTIASYTVTHFSLNDDNAIIMGLISECGQGLQHAFPCVARLLSKIIHRVNKDLIIVWTKIHIPTFVPRYILTHKYSDYYD